MYWVRADRRGWPSGPGVRGTLASWSSAGWSGASRSGPSNRSPWPTTAAPSTATSPRTSAEPTSTRSTRPPSTPSTPACGPPAANAATAGSASAEASRRCGPVSASAVREVHSVLSGAFKQVMVWGWTAHNRGRPAQRADRTQVARPRPRAGEVLTFSTAPRPSAIRQRKTTDMLPRGSPGRARTAPLRESAQHARQLFHHGVTSSPKRALRRCRAPASMHGTVEPMRRR